MREIVAPDPPKQGAERFGRVFGGSRRRHRPEVGRDGGEVKRWDNAGVSMNLLGRAAATEALGRDNPPKAPNLGRSV